MNAGAYDFHLFDLDGTLVDAEWSYTREVFDAVGDAIGRPFSDEEARIVWHGLGGARNATLREMGIDPDPFWEAFHDVEDPLARAEASFLHPDAERLLAELEGPTGLVTHCQRFLAGPVLDGLDLRDHFDAVVCCTKETGWKPDPAPVRLAMTELGVDPDAGDRGYLAGDGESDVGAAWNAGLDAVHVERLGHQTRGRCVLGDYRLESFDDFASLVDGAPDTAPSRDVEPHDVASSDVASHDTILDTPRDGSSATLGCEKGDPTG